jgi:DNA-binding NtrC family response regulator
VKKGRILVLDDDDAVRRIITDILVEEGHTVLGLSSILQAREAMQDVHYDAVVTDMKLQDGNGIDFLRLIKRAYPKTEVILMTGYASLESALEAIHLGAFDYLPKPLRPEQLLETLRRLACFASESPSETYDLKEVPVESAPVDVAVWGDSPEMQKVGQIVKQVAPTQATVLIQGESGTGKEVVAKAIYQGSSRADKAFVKINCAAIPETLMETEFFGHEKGAFTGAVQRREGRFELADGGTLLLDEITEIPPTLQVKLLRVLQEQEFERVGGTKTMRVDVRIIATTNRDLTEEVRRGRFREDLYYRLNVVPISLPPLRNRGPDLDRLADHFVSKLARKYGKELGGLSAGAREKLRDYSWPGNVRELQNMIERIVIVTKPGTILEPTDIVLPEAIPASDGMLAHGPLPTIEEMEKRLIAHTLKQTGNNKSRAALKLGISVRTLRNKLQAYQEAGLDIASGEALLASGPYRSGEVPVG